MNKYVLFLLANCAISAMSAMQKTADANKKEEQAVIKGGVLPHVVDTEYTQKVERALREDDIETLEEILESAQLGNVQFEVIGEPDFFLKLIKMLELEIPRVEQRLSDLSKTTNLIGAIEKSGPENPDAPLYARALLRKKRQKASIDHQLENTEQFHLRKAAEAREERLKTQQSQEKVEDGFEQLAAKAPTAITEEQATEFQQAKEARLAKKTAAEQTIAQSATAASSSKYCSVL